MRGDCRGRWVCIRCSREWHDPPYLPLKFNTHIRQHLARYHPSGYTVRWWCFSHDDYEETWGVAQLSLWQVA